MASSGIYLADLRHVDQHVDQLGQDILSASSAWTTERIEINGRKGRRTICVVDKDKIHYRIYDLDSLLQAEDEAEQIET